MRATITVSSNTPKMGIQSGMRSMGEMTKASIARSTFLSRSGMRSSFATARINSMSCRIVFKTSSSLLRMKDDPAGSNRKDFFRGGNQQIFNEPTNQECSRRSPKPHRSSRHRFQGKISRECSWRTGQKPCQDSRPRT